MKLSWLLSVIVLIIVLFLLLGLVSQGETITTERTIEVPIEYAWEVYHDEQEYKYWIPGFLSIEQTNNNVEKVGSEFLVKMKNSNNEISETKQTILTHEILDIHELAYDNEMLSGTIKTIFNSTEEGTTELKVSNRYRAKNFLMRAILHLFNGNVTQTTDAQYDNLKRLIEKKYAQFKPVEPGPSENNILTDSISVPADTLNI